MNTIIHGPQGCGKSHHGAALAAHFGCSLIVHEWDGVEPIPDGAMALTNTLPAVVEEGVRVLGFDAACREAGISRS